MSYDCMVFDPEAWPFDAAGFKDMYDAHVADGKLDSYDPASTDHPGLLGFYDEMRQMFTPFNGPDKVSLPENASQVRIMRTCEYLFLSHAIYMMFRWPAADMARAAASRFAKEFDLGFYHLSVRNGPAIFPGPEGRIWPTGRNTGDR